MKKLCISTVVDRKYHGYMPLFVYCCNRAYPEYDIKLFTYGDIKPHIREALNMQPGTHEIISGVFDRYHHTKYAPISWRFVVPPKYYEGYDYVYITDIDMMLVREETKLIDFHVKEMKKTQMCYSNSRRNGSHWKGKISLTGLHFVDQNWFKRTEKTRKKYAALLKAGDVGKKREYDGHMLWRMVKESKLEVCRKYPLVVRHHGIHLGNFRLFETMAKRKKRMGKTKCRVWRRCLKDKKFQAIKELVARDVTIRTQLNKLREHCKKVMK